MPIASCFLALEPLRIAAAASRICCSSIFSSAQSFEMIRGGQFGPSVRVHYELGYVTAVCAAMIGLGLGLCRRVHRHLVIE